MLFRSIFLLLLVFSGMASAQMNCTSDSESYNISIGNIYVPATSSAGDILNISPHTVNVTCTGTGNFQQVMGVKNSSWYSSGLTVNVDGVSCGVIDRGTAISDLGLGIVWTNRNSVNNSWTCMTSVFNGTSSTGSIRRGLKSDGTTTLTDKFYIVRTAEPLKYGEAGAINQSIDIDEADADRVSRGNLYQINFSGVINIGAGGCSVDAYKTVSMGTISAASFSGPGSTGPNVPFNILLTDCHNTAVSAAVELEPVYGYADEANGVMALSNEAGSAQGVGIQLLVNGNKIDYQKIYKFPLQAGTTTIPLIARYYQYLNSIQAGSADSALIFYIFYE